jgi:hypothetical protein
MKELEIEIDCVEVTIQSLQTEITGETAYGRWPDFEGFKRILDNSRLLEIELAKLDVLVEIKASVDSNKRK